MTPKADGKEQTDSMPECVVAPASSGPAALVERLRAEAADQDGQPWPYALLAEAADALASLVEDRDRWRISSNHYGEKLTALASASPAPAAEQVDEISRRVRLIPALTRDIIADVQRNGEHAAYNIRQVLADMIPMASPAPACAACAAKDEHIEAARVAIAQAQEWAEKWKALAFREQALQQSQAQEIARLRSALTDIASFGEGVVVGSAFDEPHSARLARAALKGQQP